MPTNLLFRRHQQLDRHASLISASKSIVIKFITLVHSKFHLLHTLCDCLQVCPIPISASGFPAKSTFLHSFAPTPKGELYSRKERG